MADLARLVESYWEYHQRFTSENRTDRLAAADVEWAPEHVDNLVRSAPSEIITLLVAIADGAPDDTALAYLGAGPVEDLLCSGGSDVVFDRVEDAARRSASFRKALRCAWFDDVLPRPIATRLRAFGEPY